MIKDGHEWRGVLLKEQQSYYYVSRCGLIGSTYGRKWRVRKTHDNRNGYLALTLAYKGTDYTVRVHRLVALAFIPNPNDLPEVNHINHDKYDNRVINLEWATEDYNAQEAAKYGKLSRGSRKLPPKPVGKYFAGILLKTYPSLGRVKKDGYPRISVDRAANSGKIYQGFYWKFLS
jgi:hypothetical protein